MALDIRAALNGKLRRMHYVQRYSSLPVVRPENVAEHSWQIAMLSYLIGRDLESRGITIVMGDLLAKAVTHDMSEAISGDIIRSYKYSSAAMTRACQDADLINMDALVKEIGVDILFDDWQNAKDGMLEGQIVKLADWLCVVSYCVAERRLGNLEIEGVLRHLYETAISTYHGHEYLHRYVDELFPNRQWDDPYEIGER